MINIPFSKEELTAIVQTSDLAIKAGGLQNARILVPICDRIALAVAADEEKTAAKLAPANAGGDQGQKTVIPE